MINVYSMLGRDDLRLVGAFNAMDDAATTSVIRHISAIASYLRKENVMLVLGEKGRPKQFIEKRTDSSAHE